MEDLITADAQRIAADWSLSTTELKGAVVAVSGASGLIGRHTVSLLLELSRAFNLDTTVVAMGRDETRLHKVFKEADDLLFFSSDVTAAWPKATHLIHAASPATPGAFADDPVGVIKANVIGALAALQEAEQLGAYVAFVSTMEIYGKVPRPAGLPEGADIVIDESTLGLVDPMELRSAYPESKRLAETLCVAYAEQYGVRSDVVRVSHSYGPGTNPADDRVQVQFVKQAVAGEPIVLKSDGSLRRSYTYAADSAAAIVAVLSTRSTRRHTEAFNVADNSARISIRELAELSLEAAGRSPDELVFDIPADTPAWSKMPSGTFLDTARIEALGWKPHFTLPEGLRRMAEYLKAAK
ncbi:MAG: NAD-dependent epimerase/dehydratase family protein [Propionibacteriaceae bacterium]|jgi:dTDP-glucose 4,6-dehydratase|nr:NAD-dependent epimerase/dehydratase family protein [Propionibacteriaceae bacterium]